MQISKKAAQDFIDSAELTCTIQDAQQYLQAYLVYLQLKGAVDSCGLHMFEPSSKGSAYFNLAKAKVHADEILKRITHGKCSECGQLTPKQ